MVAAIQYGGRITDDLDQLLMDTYAAKVFDQARCSVLTQLSIRLKLLCWCNCTLQGYGLVAARICE